MGKMFIEWLSGLKDFSLLSLALGIVLASAWMTELHLTMTQASASISELSLKVDKNKETVSQELNTQRQITIDYLQSIDRRLSHIEGKLSK